MPGTIVIKLDLLKEAFDQGTIRPFAHLFREALMSMSTNQSMGGLILGYPIKVNARLTDRVSDQAVQMAASISKRLSAGTSASSKERLAELSAREKRVRMLALPQKSHALQIAL